MATVDKARAVPLESRPARARRKSDLMRQQRIWGWIFLSPWIIGFLAFTAAPIVVSIAPQCDGLDLSGALPSSANRSNDFSIELPMASMRSS